MVIFVKILNYMEINHQAPVVQEKEIQIKATPQKTWQVLVDINNWSKWNPKINNPLLKDELKVGANFKWSINHTTIKSKVHTYKNNEKFGWVGKAFGTKAIHTWHLHQTQDGTSVVVEESMEGWLMKLFKTKMNTILEQDVMFWLKKLKDECEK